MLELNDVSFGYPDRPVLSGVSLQIADHEITTLIGPNGSGKSTLLRTLMGLNKPLGGSIKIHGKNLLRMGAEDLSLEVSLLPSETRPVFSILVRDLLSLGARRQSPIVKKSILHELVDAFSLAEILDRDALTLSSGEIQRALLAHTLAGMARLTLLDEPFTHLDWNLQKTCVRFFKDWSSRHKVGFLIALHELQWIPELSQNTIALGDGKILATGPAEKVFANPEVCQLFDFSAQIDENPIDGSRRLTLGKRNNPLA